MRRSATFPNLCHMFQILINRSAISKPLFLFFLINSLYLKSNNSYLIPHISYLKKMGRTNDKSLKDAIEQMLNVYKLKRKFDETSLVVAWPEIMGKAIGNRTKEIFIRDRKLFVRVESSVIKNELLMMRTNIIEKMNEHAGGNVIDGIVVL